MNILQHTCKCIVVTQERERNLKKKNIRDEKEGKIVKEQRKKKKEQEQEERRGESGRKMKRRRHSKNENE